MIGETVAARFRIEQLLGRGGNSSVWLAQDEELMRPVTLKWLHHKRVTSPDAVSRFEREARTLASLTHPGIVTVIDRGEWNGRPFMVCEYVDGTDLARHIAQATHLGVAESLAIASQIAEALAYAHERGVIHRDVKPQNVLITRDGFVKLADFGIARVEEAPDLTAAGRVLGTGDYVAPEQALGKRLDGRADVYALGAVLYTCLTGAPPYRGDSFVEVADKHVRAAIPSVRTLRPGVPEQVDRLIARALAKDPAARFPTAGVFHGEIDALLAEAARTAGTETSELPLVAHALHVEDLDNPTAVRDAMRARRRRRQRLVPVVLLAGVLAGGIGWAVYLARNWGAPAAAVAPPPAPTLSTPTGPGAPVVTQLLSAQTFDPQGDETENATEAPLAIDGKPETQWTTETRTYTSAQFAPTAKAGVGLVLVTQRPLIASDLRVTTNLTGWAAQVYTRPDVTQPNDLSRWTKVSDPFTMIHTSESIPLSVPSEARLYLLWITRLAPADAGGFEARVSEAELLHPADGS